MTDEKTDVKVKKEEKKATVVVTELPQQPYRDVKDEQGIEYTLMTSNEALAEILDIARQLKKGLL